MAPLQPALVAPSSGEETHLAADGGTESIAVPLARSRTISRATAIDRRRERRWIRAAQSGSEEALEQLYRRHWPWAHRAAYLVVHDAAAAEDIAQEAFLAAVRALDRFDRRRPFGPWLNRIVVNRAIDWARARALRQEAAVEPELEVGAGSHDRAQRQGSRALLAERRRRAGLALAGASGGRGAALPARVHAGRDRRSAGASRAARSTRGCAGPWIACRAAGR